LKYLNYKLNKKHTSPLVILLVGILLTSIYTAGGTQLIFGSSPSVTISAIHGTSVSSYGTVFMTDLDGNSLQMLPDSFTYEGNLPITLQINEEYAGQIVVFHINHPTKYVSLRGENAVAYGEQQVTLSSGFLNVNIFTQLPSETVENLIQEYSITAIPRLDVILNGGTFKAEFQNQKLIILPDIFEYNIPLNDINSIEDFKNSFESDRIAQIISIENSKNSLESEIEVDNLNINEAENSLVDAKNTLISVEDIIETALTVNNLSEDTGRIILIKVKIENNIDAIENEFKNNLIDQIELEVVKDDITGFFTAILSLENKANELIDESQTNYDNAVNSRDAKIQSQTDFDNKLKDLNNIGKMSGLENELKIILNDSGERNIIGTVYVSDGNLVFESGSGQEINISVTGLSQQVEAQKVQIESWIEELSEM